MRGKKSPAPRAPSADPFASLEEGTAALALAAAAEAGPAARVKAELLARIRAARTAPAPAAEKTATDAPPQGWRFSALAAAEGWLALPFPGVRMREVCVDAARDTALLFVEMARGAVFPEHVHASEERGLVLSGDLSTGGRVLQAGDFYEAAAGTRHERISSPSGCTGLLWVGASAWQQWRQHLGV